MSWHKNLPRHQLPVPHIAWNDLKAAAPKKELERFGKWFCGQTGLLRDDGQMGIYTWDFDRWIEQGKKTKQGEDFD